MKNEMPATREGRHWLKRTLRQEVNEELEKIKKAHKRIEFKRQVIEEIDQLDKEQLNGL